ncbi:hypothetical protein WJX81_005519 [Elliptochloris bilobata]|uniref:Ran-binding protein 10 n=1 Tax=Elliptochloris bilobata TaxID=381761 RepID=A0AAW1RKZ0_9CHLO
MSLATSFSSKFPSPLHWDKQSGGRVNSRWLEVTDTRVKYIGPGSEDKDAASVRADTPVPPDSSVYYYEVAVINRGRDGFIGIGFATSEVPLDRLPGWDSHSYGYHGDDGCAFKGSGKGNAYGPTFTTGDVVGVLFDRVDCCISFVKNGIDLGVAFADVPLEERLYPCVGLRTPDEEVDANFGASPFVGDFPGMVAECRERLTERVLATPLPGRGKAGSLLGELVFGYLQHHGHWETAAAVGRDVLGGAVSVSQADIADARSRQAVAEAAAAGRVEEAVDMAEALVPGALAAQPAVLFRLHCQRFLELVRARDDEGAMRYGRSVLSGAAASDQDQELLQDALSLLAYEEPEASPCGELLGAKAREDAAAALSAALLAHSGRSAQSALERCLAQLGAVRRELVQLGDASAAMLRFDKSLPSNGMLL